MNKDTMETKTDRAAEEAACAAAPEEPMEEELAEAEESAAPQKKWKRLWTRWKSSKKARIITIVVVVFLVLVLLLVCFPRIIVPLLLIGLPLGFRYRFSGPLAERKAVKGFLASLREAWERFLARLRRP